MHDRNLGRIVISKHGLAFNQNEIGPDHAASWSIGTKVEHCTLKDISGTISEKAVELARKKLVKSVLFVLTKDGKLKFWIGYRKLKVGIIFQPWFSFAKTNSLATFTKWQSSLERMQSQRFWNSKSTRANVMTQLSNIAISFMGSYKHHEGCGEPHHY